MRRATRALSLAATLVACSHANSSDAPARTRRTEAPAPTSAASGDAGAPAFPSLASLPPQPDPPEPPATCVEAKSVTLFVAPAFPWTGSPLHVLAVSDAPIAGALRVSPKSKAAAATTATTATTATIAESTTRKGSGPYFYVATAESPEAGAYTASFVESACAEGKSVATIALAVSKWKPQGPPAPQEGDPLWPVRRSWTRSLENVYSAWIETLFDAPDDEQPSWPALHEVLRDPKRNLLHDYLAGGEDSTNAPSVRPDCADLPYFLRAYFAWKMKLPFGLSECNRGGGGVPPSCRATITTNEDPPAKTEPTAVKQFGAFLHGPVADKAHSGSARQPFEEQNSDYYPVALSWESLRPGTIYGDPYGHVLMVAKKLPQTGARGGVLYAVDGQPDGTVARKRYWRGNFLYAVDPALGGPGWKRFRPVARRGGKLARLDDKAIEAMPSYGDVSREAETLDVEGFYDKMDEVLSPHPRDPYRAMMEVLAALEEQVKTRVKSVDNGRKWLETATSPASMPDGAEIFETSGPWEDFSTPSRDLRLLIAIDVARGFPSRVARRPSLYAMPEGRTPDDVKAELERVLASELASRKVQYTRTDGSPWTLSLADVIARSAALETAYDTNDCVEVRWGAPAGSDEAKPCRGHAPGDQRERMETYRAWFHDRRRPPRK